MLIASSLCFFFNDTATTEIYTLSLHDALPISAEVPQLHGQGLRDQGLGHRPGGAERDHGPDRAVQPARDLRALERSEEHTSELQSHVNLVCRLLLEKKKKQKSYSHAIR